MSGAAAAASAGMTVQQIASLVAKMDRPALLALLELQRDCKMIGDVEGLHPITLYQKKTLSIDAWRVPFLSRGHELQCCKGATLSRFGHKTIALKCFSMELGESGDKCVHCEQLWAKAEEDTYELKREMSAAWAFYEKGERRALKNWQTMKDLPDFYSDQIQIIKDVLKGSSYEVGANWPGVAMVPALRYFLQNAGVLFADAGRSRNPYPRTAREQRDIAGFARDMITKYLRIYATVKPEVWAEQVQRLHRYAKVVQKAAVWAMQAEFVADPIFVGPIVAADIVAAGFNAAEKRYQLLVQAINDGEDGDVDLGIFSWGTAVEKFVEWAKTVRTVKRPAVRNQLRSALSDADNSHKSQSSSGSKKLTWWYGVARGKHDKHGTYQDWDGKVKDLVIGVPNAIFKKFRSRRQAGSFVERMRARDTPAKWWVLKGSHRDGCYASKLVALSYKGSGELLPMWSIAAAKEFLACKHIEVFNDTVARDEAAQSKKFFALTGGSKDGVYESVRDMLAAKREGGGVHEKFASKELAQKRCDEVNAGATAEFYVVWDGTSTGVMNEEDMLAATCGVESVIEGPMTKRDAELIWTGKADEVKSTASAASARSASSKSKAGAQTASKKSAAAAPATPPSRKQTSDITLQSPSDAQIEKAWMAGKKRVFSCWVSPTVGRVALSWEEAAKGIVDPEVKVTSSESDLFRNIAKAEKLL